MSQLIVTLKNEKDTAFLLKLLKELKSVKDVRVGKSSRKGKKINEEALLSEESLAKEWLSEEDERWDKLLK